MRGTRFSKKIPARANLCGDWGLGSTVHDLRVTGPLLVLLAAVLLQPDLVLVHRLDRGKPQGCGLLYFRVSSGWLCLLPDGHQVECGKFCLSQLHTCFPPCGNIGLHGIEANAMKRERHQVVKALVELGRMAMSGAVIFFVQVLVSEQMLHRFEVAENRPFVARNLEILPLDIDHSLAIGEPVDGVRSASTDLADGRVAVRLRVSTDFSKNMVFSYARSALVEHL